MPIRIFLSGSKRFFAVSPTSLDAMGVIPINPIAPVFLFSFFDFPSDSTTIIALNNGKNLMAFCSAACFLIFLCLCRENYLTKIYFCDNIFYNFVGSLKHYKFILKEGVKECILQL